MPTTPMKYSLVDKLYHPPTIIYTLAPGDTVTITPLFEDWAFILGVLPLKLSAPRGPFVFESRECSFLTAYRRF